MSSKLVIENMDEVLLAAKLKRNGWKRDYDNEPWIEDKKEWRSAEKEKHRKKNAAARRAFYEQKAKDDTARFKRNSFKRWRKRK